MSGGHPLPTPSANTWTEPPWCGWIETTGDALLILEAARRGLIPRVTRRLVDSERRMITSGSVFVFDEDESGIKRWTDGYFWSPSRILGNFLLYRETDKRGAGHRSTRAEQELMQQEAASSSAATRGLHIENQSLSRSKADSSGLTIDKQRERALIGSLTNSYKFKEDGLMKKTFSVTINGVAQHLISYYKIADVESGRLRSPSSLPELASLDISPEYLDKTHFRNPPKVEVGTDGVPRYRGECDDIEGNNSYSAGYSGPGASDLEMLGGPVQAGDPLHLNGPGNIPPKRNRPDEPYGPPPQQKRPRRGTGASELSSGLPGTGRSTSPPDHQPHVIHQSPPPHQMSISPHLPSSQQSQAGGTVPYDAVAMQPQFPQQPQSIHQHIQHPQLTQQPQTAPYQQPQPTQQNQQPATPTASSYPPPQYFYPVAPHSIYPPPPGAVGQQPPYSSYGNPYVPAPHPSYWSGPNMPSSVIATASPMSTSSDSPSPSPLHLTHAQAHPQHRRPSMGQNPTSGLQNVTAAGTDTTANPGANTNAGTNTTRSEQPGPRSDPSQKPPGPLRQEPPVPQHHHPPPAATSNKSGAEGTATDASSGSPASVTTGTTTGPHTSTSTPGPGPAPYYQSYYPSFAAPPGHPHAHPHLQSPGPAAPMMGSLSGPPAQPGQPPATMSMGPVPVPQGMGPPLMGMPPMSFGSPYQWPHAPPPPGMYPGYIPPPGMAPGMYGAYVAPPYGVAATIASGAGPAGGTGGGAAAPQGSAQTQGTGAKESAGAGQSGTTAAAASQGGGGRSGASGGTTDS